MKQTKFFISKIEKEQISLYKTAVKSFGEDIRSIKWNNDYTQDIRFAALIRIFKYEKGIIRIHDVGCGLSHFKRYLDSHKIANIYSGSDITEEMLTYSRKKYPKQIYWKWNIAADKKYMPSRMKHWDYYCASGIFFTKENASKKQWESFIKESLRNMYTSARKGISVNFLTAFADYYDPNLYYADPMYYFNWCRKNLSKYIELYQDSPLYEFTLSVYNPAFMKHVYPLADKYFH